MRTAKSSSIRMNTWLIEKIQVGTICSHMFSHDFILLEVDNCPHLWLNSHTCNICTVFPMYVQVYWHQTQQWNCSLLSSCKYTQKTQTPLQVAGYFHSSLWTKHQIYSILHTMAYHNINVTTLHYKVLGRSTNNVLTSVPLLAELLSNRSCAKLSPKSIDSRLAVS